MVSNLLKIMMTFIFENTQWKVLVLAVKTKPCPGPRAEFSNLVTSLVTGYVIPEGVLFTVFLKRLFLNDVCLHDYILFK